MALYWPFLLDLLPHHYVHDWSLRFAANTQYPRPPANLQFELLGMQLKSPVIAAAGLDRTGEHIERLLSFGFGCVEVGSVTLNLERSVADCMKIEKSEARVTHLGTCFNWGALKAKQSLLKTSGLRGVSISPNQHTLDVVPNLLPRDFSFVISELYSLVDYFALSLVSRPGFDLGFCASHSHLPNILQRARDALDTEIGLRVYANPTADRRYLVPALLVKVNSDCATPEELVAACLEAEVDGLIVAGNSTTGLGGAEIREESLALLKRLKLNSQNKLTLIASGGIVSGADALERLKAGASAVQIYTSFVTDGPRVVSRINNEISSALETEGFKSLQEALRHYHKA